MLGSIHKLPLPAAVRGLLDKPLYRNAYALVVSTGASAGLGMVYWILAANLYSIEAFGLNAAAISAMIFLSGISQLNLMSAFIRFIPTAGSSTARFVLSGYGISTLLSLIFASIYVAGLHWWSPDFTGDQVTPLFLAGFVIATIIWTVFALQDNVLTGLRASVWIPVENILYALAKLILLVLLQPWIPEYGIFVAWVLPTLIAILPINALIFGRLIPTHTQNQAIQTEALMPRMIAKFVAGNYLGSLFTLASARLLPVIVAAVAGVTANAFFYLAWTIANTLHLMATTMSMSLTVEGALDRTALTTQARHFFLHKLQLLAPAVLVLFIAAPYVLQLSGAEYALEGTMVFRLLLLATLPRIVTSLYLSIARVQSQLRTIIMVQALFCGLTLGLSLLLLPSFGITGVGIAFLFSESVVAIGLLATSLRPLLFHSSAQG
jgi:O-antigen/teichoic acid export membrane protein